MKREDREPEGALRLLQVSRTPATAAFVVAILLVSGCQALLPSKLTSFGEDRRILKQAENDPFPSPADVGLEKAPDES
jgi:hypothetical protein